MRPFQESGVVAIRPSGTDKMWIQSLLVAATVACVSASFSVPVQIHHEIEAQLQKQTNLKTLRWDPTNYLSFLAAVYAQCVNLYGTDGTRLLQKGRVNNATAYTTFQQYFHPSLLQSNLVVMYWDIESDESQDAGTVDRDIRKLSGKTNGAGPLGNLPNIDSSIRSYDRFSCSVETKCRVANGPVMALVCVFGQSNPPKQVSGTANELQTPRAAATTRAAATRAAPTTRPRATRPAATTPTTTTTTTTTTEAPQSIANPIGGGLYDTYKEHSQEFYDTIMNNKETILSALPEIVPDEQKLVDLGLCQFASNPEEFTPELLAPLYGSEVEPILYSTTLSPRPTDEDLTSFPITDVAKGALRSALQEKVRGDTSLATNSVACAWAMCTDNFLLACAAWGITEEDYTSEGKASSF